MKSLFKGSMCLIALAILIIAAGSCGPSSSRQESVRADFMAKSEMAVMAPAPAQAGAMARNEAAVPPADASAGDAGVGSLTNLTSSQPDRYLIKNATLTVETENSRAATDKLVASLQPSGAYISNLNESVDGLGRRTVTLQVRVPADKFDQSMTQLETLGKVLFKQVTTEDVTEEYVDTESRTRNLKKAEERLVDHLSRAGELEDILRVEQELTRVREQIERLDGRLRFLTNRVSFSTISVTIQEAAKAEPIVPPQSFSTAKEFSEAARSLVIFAQGLWSRMIWFIVWLPVYAVPVLVAYLVYRRLKRRTS